MVTLNNLTCLGHVLQQKKTLKLFPGNINTLNPLIIYLPSYNPSTAPKKNTTLLPKKRKTSASARKNTPTFDTIANIIIPVDQEE